MQIPALPHTEQERLLALKLTGLLDTESEPRFDRLTRLAQMTLGTEIVLISLVDAELQWFKSKQGLDACETTRDISFCGHAILADGIFEVPDTLTDVRFADNPLVLGAPFIRFYAGVPLLRNSQPIGTLCFIDSRPRHFSALSSAPRNQYTAELHLQMIKYADDLKTITAKEFCEGVGLRSSFGTEFSKMRNLLGRLKAAGMDTVERHNRTIRYSSEGSPHKSAIA